MLAIKYTLLNIIRKIIHERPAAKVVIPKNQRGMTLIEIMVVLVIIGIVGGLVGTSVFGQLKKANVRAAKAQISNIAGALDLYKLDNKGRYPNTAEGLVALTTSKNGQEPTMERIPKDPWDNEYSYIQPGTHNAHSFDLMSNGPDGVAGGGDDVGNWDEQQ